MSDCSFAINNSKYYLKSYTPGRTLNGKSYRIDRITIHQVWGHCSNATLKSVLDNASASCNYCMDDSGTPTVMVHECDRSWCSSSSSNDVRSITIETSNDRQYPYKCTDDALIGLVRLCADICQRNGIKKMHWVSNLVPYPNPKTTAQKQANEKACNDKNASLPSDEAIFTIHRWFFDKPCPGDYIEGKLGWICDEVNKVLQEEEIHVGDIVPMEVYEIKEGYAYGKVKCPDPEPTPTPTPEEIKVGDKVTINPGAKAGGMNANYYGKPISSQYANGKYVDTVVEIAMHNFTGKQNVQEAKLKNIVTWVATSSLTLVK